ncbi:hypothetical protein [Streptomyces sp. NPDC047141]|uniref:hypothetical protein n=1 Tax=Streptomyces sp. NPDC047141 TaxID=3155738 RepID=UPI0033F21E85
MAAEQQASASHESGVEEFALTDPLDVALVDDERPTTASRPSSRWTPPPRPSATYW